MSAIPGSLETDNQPPLTVPLRHFFVGLIFLCAAIILAVADQIATVSAFSGAASLHLLLAGWICVTIMGAMTQFVPVWSGTVIHSRVLANGQLLLVAVGLTGFTTALVTGWLSLLVLFGLAMLAGFWLFVYNLTRTINPLNGLDMTERHFIFALGCFLILTTVGVILAMNLAGENNHPLPVSYSALLGTHLTIAVFGAVITTIYGTIYQLGTMFTQTELRGIDHPLQRIQEGAQYGGVILLATGRFIEQPLVATVGGILIIIAALAVAFIIGRKLIVMQVDWTPMHRRYVVVVLSLALWALSTIPTWVVDPLAYENLFGYAGTTQMLLIGVIGFVVLGTLYHIIPFIIWINHYSDRLGLEKVPMIDDLYSERVANAEFGILIGGLSMLILADIGILDELFTAGGFAIFGIGILLFIGNMAAVVYRHSTYTVVELFFGSSSA